MFKELIDLEMFKELIIGNEASLVLDLFFTLFDSSKIVMAYSRFFTAHHNHIFV